MERHSDVSVFHYLGLISAISVFDLADGGDHGLSAKRDEMRVDHLRPVRVSR
jgi:hypothetical protein